MATQSVAKGLELEELQSQLFAEVREDGRVWRHHPLLYWAVIVAATRTNIRGTIERPAMERT
jgi:hypothetical protein